MAKKKKSKKRDPNTLYLIPKGADKDESSSKLTVDPAVQSAITIKKFGADEGFRDTDLTYLVDTLSEQIKATNSNDLTDLEGMLTGQAYVLNAIFNRLTQVASRNLNEHLKGAEICLKLGLRAQSQCRSTIEAVKHR